MLVERDMRGVQAHLLWLVLTTLSFAPVLVGGTILGQFAHGLVAATAFA